MITADEVREDPMIRALYSPRLREVGCVLIQAAFGGDRRACNAVSDWFTGVEDVAIMISAPLSQWRQIGAMPKEQRPGPEHFRRAT